MRLLLLLSFALLLFAREVAAETINFAWDPVTLGADGKPVQGLLGYKLYLSRTSGLYKYPSTFISASKTTASVNLTTGGEYFAVVRAYNGAGESGNSNEVKFTVVVPPPAPPADFTASK